MPVLETITQRHAFRALSAEPIADEVLTEITQAGCLAPSCYNNQPWRIIVARGERLTALKTSLAEGNAWAQVAPAIIAMAVRACDDCRLEDGRDYAFYDAGLCAMNMILQATALGLVAHPIAGYSPAKAKKALGIPKDYVLINLIILGRRGESNSLTDWQRAAESGQRERRPVDTTVAFEAWPAAWQT
ncbi:MAG: hypothetical protein A2087_07910 [Spirochaetes bacterium GWD1_61_31]|nr:MAG: hypothetical protein A2Y37_06150 [Spirochaetes bacterium GWB1_60_80]OHD35005.1 MAG: hypothetical protein A2004_03975 [Spirochaetes bacterium GWC1_61_12]OHD40475.1 MAG: hypothetical protein A2087_07910 [Spirochaetes bacterium GWD1_61_31]OHD43100.1 MAG: hypothetical protein A2Y35_01465 [Spirochaetes bacterium GWE1_60_18]OHD59694.1 MAG: hypothetical protein A2Y32_12340 [Spirochaetes bacterium GWF1_60_12]